MPFPNRPQRLAEMLGCELLLLSYGGHFLYDAAVILIAAAYSRSIWRQCDDEKAALVDNSSEMTSRTRDDQASADVEWHT